MDIHQKTRQSKQPLVLTALGTLAVAVLFWAAFLKPTAAPTAPVVTKAVAVLNGDFGAGGTVTFVQAAPAAPVTITGELHGLDPRALRGFHVHVSGDLSSGCASAGAHFNPLGNHHGARTDLVRHAGDLGNVASDAQGVTRLALQDEVISLNGPMSIVGRAVVLHAGTDDLGKGSNEESLKTGNAGARSACGVIGISA
ncbi:Superoxide dismutase [Cu-Zn] [Taiwanofungus camphoratus]|nr:Superoxide dismutase [Cu-Zn] [Antrodia cinnamomea]KAI0927127.1 Superoxide dismutase [Cu-Zn] [Antrodia cinnamomea]KAI0947267.1 Superoxide dismutase [Cu-Zn] [Antrodia cinnamomea]KAI0953273.1 Superoxide dismutase [Cu-Zn] [Antrodia cinnamomea]